MASSRVSVKLDTTKLDKMSKYAQKNVDAITRDEAETVLGDIRSNWSPSSPSSPGTSPAKVTGDLDDSGEVRQLSKSDAPSYVVIFKSFKASMLELGTINMPARPFMRPAVFRAEQRYPKRFKRITED